MLSPGIPGKNLSIEARFAVRNDSQQAQKPAHFELLSGNQPKLVKIARDAPFAGTVEFVEFIGARF
jgi:hypothetical protein